MAPVVAVTTCDVPAAVLVVNTAVAIPFAFVVLVATSKLPPFVLVHVTTWLAVLTGLPPASDELRRDGDRRAGRHRTSARRHAILRRWRSTAP